MGNEVLPVASIVASGSFSRKIIISLVPHASQHGPIRPPALKDFSESNVNFKGFHEVNRITARARTARGTSGVITFMEKDPEVAIRATTLGGSVRIEPSRQFLDDCTQRNNKGK